MSNAVAVRDADTIKAGERNELKSLVRMRVKLLRAQIKEQHAARMAEIDNRIAAKFVEDTSRVDELRVKLDRIVARANNQVEALLAQYSDVAEPRHSAFSRPWFHRPEDNRNKLRKAMVAAVISETEAANLRVAQLESELLGELALNAIKSEAARDFVRAIPKIEDLIAADRLAEIEAKFDAEATQ